MDGCLNCGSTLVAGCSDLLRPISLLTYIGVVSLKASRRQAKRECTRHGPTLPVTSPERPGFPSCSAAPLHRLNFNFLNSPPKESKQAPLLFRLPAACLQASHGMLFWGPCPSRHLFFSWFNRIHMPSLARAHVNSR